jgi:glycosyltransferase involved in cell wall biosynthesis
MRIVVASSGLGHIARGVEAWAHDLGWALHERGHWIVLCKGGGGARPPIEHVLPCWQRLAPKTQRLASWTRRGFWRLRLGSPYELEQATFTWHLLKLLRREAIDILHVQDPTIALFVQRAARLGWVKTRTILGHGTEEPLQFLNKITYLQHLMPYHLESARAEGVWKPTWTAIPNFIDTDTYFPGRCDALRAELGIPTGGLVVLCAAAIRRNHKRIDYLLNEFAELRRTAPDLPVWLVIAGGRERDTDELVAHGHRLLGDRLRTLVSFPRERMPDLYRAADIFALTSLMEMMGIALVEASATGLPCVVNNHPVLEWIIGDGGETISMYEAGALARSLKSWLQDPTLRRERGALGRQHCVEHFSRDKVVDQIVEYYRFVLSHGGVPSMAHADTLASVS